MVARGDRRKRQAHLCDRHQLQAHELSRLTISPATAAEPGSTFHVSIWGAWRSRENGQDSQEANNAWPQTGSRAGGGRTGLRGSVRGQENRPLGIVREEGRQEGWQQPQACRENAKARTLGCASVRTGAPVHVRAGALKLLVGGRLAV